MAVTPGTRLGPYEITARIGEGGMGEVYRARDTKLNRDVALKVLPEAFTADPDRLARFKREAQLLAALNHPNIAAIHGFEESDGVQALVLELVEGPTLADRIADGPLPIDEALLIAKQIVEALEAAHEQGIIHRDLKPANIKLRPEGTVKILDFGLAKAIEPVSGASASATMSPTITSPAMTQMGVILGTAAYMAPEQAKGRAAHKRSDIWAFGCVLYEMLGGKRAFGGEDVSETLAAVLRAEPDWSALPSETPPRIRRLLQRCLNRDLKQRLQAIGEARIAIDAPEDDVRRPPARWWPWAAALVAAVVLAAAGWLRSSTPVAQPLMRLSIELPPGQDIPGIAGSVLAISPDGMRIAVITQDETGRRRLNSRRVDAHEFTPLAGTEEAIYPFFSPDGQWIGFFAEGKLKKVSADGGSLATLCDAPDPRGASWGDDGNIIAALNGGRSGFSRISSGGGSPTPVTAHGMEKVANVSSPHVLPGSKAVVFTDVAASTSPDEGTVRILSFDTGEQKILQQPGFFGRYAPSGHLIYLREATLHAAPFDIRTLTVTGHSQPVLEDVRLAGLSPAAVLDVSRTGTFVYLIGSERNSRGIFLLDDTGKHQPVHPTVGYYATPRFSPNGTRLAFAASNGPARQSDIWVRDLGAGTMLRLTRMPGANHHPVWTPDGAYLVFESVLGGSQALYWIRSDGGGEPRRLTNDNVRRVPYSFSPDGKWLAYSQAGSQNRGQLREIWTAPVERSGDEAKLGEPKLLLQSPAFLIGAQFSPDGRWVAYSSNETGTYEAYVTRFPGPRSKFPVSSGGGRYPLWSRSGRELFFVSGDGRIMVTNYSAVGDTFSMGRPSLWSDYQLPRLSTQGHDLAPDGKHFVAILEAAATGKSESVTVLLNFFDELRRRVPGGTK